TSIRSFECRIRKSFSGTVSRNKILKNRKSLLKVGDNRVFDNVLTTGCSGFLWFGHQTPHTAELTDLFFRTPRTRVKHHIDGVESLFVADQLRHQNVGQFAVGMCPDIDDLIVPLVVGDQTHVVAGHYFVYFLYSRIYKT